MISFGFSKCLIFIFSVLISANGIRSLLFSYGIWWLIEWLCQNCRCPLALASFMLDTTKKDLRLLLNYSMLDVQGLNKLNRIMHIIKSLIFIKVG